MTHPTTTPECHSFAQFTELYGEAAAESILERITSEHCSPDSVEGLDLSCRDCLDTVGDRYRLGGHIEHNGAWYYFDLTMGASHGIEIDTFELSLDADPEDLDPSLPAQQLRDCLKGYAQGKDFLQTAGGRALALLRTEYAEGEVTRQSVKIHELLRPVLADLAVQHQDYSDDALALLSDSLKEGNVHTKLKALYDKLSEELKSCIQETCEQHGRTESASEFFALGWKSVLDTSLFWSAR